MFFEKDFTGIKDMCIVIEIFQILSLLLFIKITWWFKRWLILTINYLDSKIVIIAIKWISNSILFYRKIIYIETYCVLWLKPYTCAVVYSLIYFFKCVVEELWSIFVKLEIFIQILLKLKLRLHIGTISFNVFHFFGNIFLSKFVGV